MSEPMADDEVGFGLPDPPYVAGDHYTTCRGCDHCAELEDRYFAEKDRLQEKVTALQGELVDAELAAAEETMPDQMTGGAAMSELRAPDPTLTALDQRWDVVSIEEGLPPTAHRDAVALLEPPDVFSRQPARDARWFAVPCREFFPDAPPPGREFYNLMDQRNRVQVRTRPVKGLAWQVQP